jgi:hypothetical protein
VSAQHRRPAPLHHHFGVTVGLAACAVVLGWIVLRTDGQLLAGIALAGRVVRSSGRPQHWDGRSTAEVSWDAWVLAWHLDEVAVGLRTGTAGMRHQAVHAARWLLADEHLVTVLKLASVLALVGVVLAPAPGGLLIVGATALVVAVAVLWVHAYRHRGDPINPRPLLGGHDRTGGAR